MNIFEMIDDLILQATTEKSHYYTANVLKECKAALAEKEVACNALLKNQLDEMDEMREQIAALKAAQEEIEKEAYNARLVLILNHGHKGQYFDDGEMQCGACGFGRHDFKEPSLSEITKRIVFMINDRIASLTATVERLEAELDTWIGACAKSDKQVARQAEQIAALKAERDNLQSLTVVNENLPVPALERQIAALKAERDSLQQYYDCTHEFESAREKAIKTLTATVERLESELEYHAWEISPAMAQAQIDSLNATVERQAEEIAALKAELVKANKDISDLLSLNRYEHDALTACSYELSKRR